MVGANPCGMGDRSLVTMRYAGTTTRESDMYNTSSNNYCDSPANSDSFSTVDFGNLNQTGNPPLAHTCSWGGQGSIWESDIRFNIADHNWTGTPSSSCSNEYDLQSVATHEDGHAMGLAHAGGADSLLTMHQGTPPCSSYRRNFGRGDVLGLYWIDPVS